MRRTRGWKISRTTTGTGIDTSFFHAAQSFFDRDFGDAGKVVHLHHGEGFQVYAGAALLQAANHFKKIVKWQIGMEAADDMEFGCAFANPLLRALVNFLERVGIGARRVLIAAKGAELAVRDAHVGGIDVAD